MTTHAAVETCSIEGCTQKAGPRRGWCMMHYTRWQRHRDPLYVMKPAGPSTLIRDEQGNKLCCLCKKWLPVLDFSVTPECKDGLRSSCKPCAANRKRSRAFGVSEDWFATTLAAQGNKCAICGSSEPRGRGWAIDHDHNCCPSSSRSCGSCIRGILCTPCNCGLGMLRESPDVLRAAAAYLDKAAT